ncbi:MAG: hypothetical protein SGBAC_011144 [Bacillariaceae sp.]
MSSTAAQSDDFDNPWESAANDDTYRSTSLRAEERATSSADVVASGAAPIEGDARPPSLKNRCIWGNQLLDGFVGALFSVFVFFLYHKNKVDSSTTHLDVLTLTLMALSILLVAILLLRSVIGGRFFHFNMNSRPMLVLLYLVTASILFADANHLPVWIMKLQFERKEILPLCLVFFSLLEVALFFFLRHCYFSELEDIQDAENLSRYTSRASGRSPWWWSRNGRRDDISENLGEPLLFGQPSWANTSNSYRVQEGVNGSPPSSSWWPFSRGSGSGQNARDDGSVDYASLDEDWASRSQADPYWWSRDGDGN